MRASVRRTLAPVLLASLLALLPGCEEDAPSAPDLAAAPRPARAAPVTMAEKLTALPARMAASQILIAFREAVEAPAGVTRSQEEAEALVARLAAELRRAPARFAALARRHSDGVEAREGGYLGNWRRGEKLFPFEAAVAKLRPGEVSPPVQTPFGLHLIRREPLLPGQRVSAAHLVVAYAGALRAPPGVRRSREQALARARALALAAQPLPDAFAALVREHSDGPRAALGGSLGGWVTGLGQRLPIFDRAVLRLELGATTSRPVETAFGFHVIRRLDPRAQPQLWASQIIISHTGSRPPNPNTRRTRRQARALARRLHRQLRAQPKRFVALVRRFSDGREADRDGHLGPLGPGTLLPAVELALTRLAPGEISPPVETERGFHILRREPPPGG